MSTASLSYVVAFYDLAQYRDACGRFGTIGGPTSNLPPQEISDYYTFPITTGGTNAVGAVSAVFVPDLTGIQATIPGFTNNTTIGTIPANFTLVYTPPYQILALSGAASATLQWAGMFLYLGPPVGVSTSNLATYRWMDGFELPLTGEGQVNQNPSSGRRTRSASRTPEGMGFSAYSDGSAVTSAVRHNLPASQQFSWERFYFRIKKMPTANERIWQCVCTSTANSVSIRVTPNGAIQLQKNDGFGDAGNGTIGVPVGSIPLNTWIRCDVFVTPFTSLVSNTCNVTVAATFTGPMGSFSTSGVCDTFSPGGQFQFHQFSALGNYSSSASTGLQCDFDDWTNRTYDASGGTAGFGLDFQHGSHIQPLVLSGFGTGHSGNWSGDFRVLDGIPQNGTFGGGVSTAVVSTATPSAAMVANVEWLASAQVFGLMVNAYISAAGGATTGSLGYSINGAAPILVSSDITGSWAVPTIFNANSLGDGKTPTTISAITLNYTAGALSGTQNVMALVGCVDMAVNIGPEDDPTLPQPARYGPHNRGTDDPNQWSLLPQDVTVKPMTGTYTGNGTGQDISIPASACWLWIRNVTTGEVHISWNAGQIAGQLVNGTSTNKNLVSRVKQVAGHPDQFFFRVSGAEKTNTVGQTYRWTAFHDPAMRYCQTHAFANDRAAVTEARVTPDPTFLTQAAFFMCNAVLSSGTNFYKGAGHGTDTGTPFTSAVTSGSVATLATGSITTAANINPTIGETAASLWRTTDARGNLAPIAITSYTGDGAGSKNVALALSGYSPLFTLVVPHSGSISCVRDASHTGANSSLANGSGIATGITAVAANQITVGVTLNTNAVVYDVFVIGDPAGIPFVVTGDPPPTGPFTPLTAGWWKSTNLYTGSATHTSYPPTPPLSGRSWSRIGGFASGNSASFGGFPGPSVTVNHEFLYFAGDEYTTDPTVRVFDGESDRLFATVPPVAGVSAKAIVAMLLIDGVIYLTTLDSGSSAADWAGRVLQLNPETGAWTQLGAQFTGGEVPYALASYIGRLWVGTNKGNGTAGTIRWFRPGIDTAWTTDRTLSTDSVGGCLAMAEYQGQLYIGTDSGAATAAKILVRSPLGVYSTSLSSTAVITGTFRVNAGFFVLHVFNNKLYSVFWNNDTTPQSRWVSFDATNWTTVYDGAGATLRPPIAMFHAQTTLFLLGGGSSLSASLVSIGPGGTLDLSANLSDPAGATSVPLVGVLPS